MENASFNELLKEVDALSIKHDWSDSVKDCEKHDDSLLGTVWSDDENGERTNRSRNSPDENHSPNSSTSPVHLVLSQNITVRRRLKQKVFSQSLCASRGKQDKEDAFNVTIKLSFSDCYDISRENRSRNRDDFVDFELTNDCLKVEGCMAESPRTDTMSSQNNINQSVQPIEQELFHTANGEKHVCQKILDNSELIPNSVRKSDLLPKSGQVNTSNNPNETVALKQSLFVDKVSDEESCANKHSSCSPSCKVVSLSSGTDSDRDLVWESENDHVFEENRRDSLSVQLVDEIEKKTSPISPELQRTETLVTKESDLDTSDEEFEAFLVEMKTPKLKKTPKSTPSLNSFIVDDWITSSGEEDQLSSASTKSRNTRTPKKNMPKLTPRGSVISSESLPLEVQSTKVSDTDTSDEEFEAFLAEVKTPKPKTTPRSTPSVEPCVVKDYIVTSDEDEPRSNIKSKLVNPNRNVPSAKKVVTSGQRRTPLMKTTKENTPLKYASVSSIERILTPHLNTPQRFWRKTRDQLAKELFHCYNETIFDNKLPFDMPILWNKQLTKTAGYCYYTESQLSKSCRVELSEKVVDSCERIRDTLVHELCHAATWMIDGIKAGHGPHWKRWALKARLVHSDLPPVSRCHSYKINYRFIYRCIRCHHSFGRHSKSVNLQTSRCPYCHSRLELLEKTNKDGTPAKPRAPSTFALFVKNNYRKIKANEPGSSHQAIMKELSKQFAEASLKTEKENAASQITSIGVDKS